MSAATEARTRRRTNGLRRLRLPQYLGYGAGDAANNLTFSMTSMFLLLYYTDVVGLAATTVGTLFLVVRIFDGFADLFAGRLVDKTNTRWGRFRPYLLFAAVPLLLLNVAVFSVPDLGATGTLVYAYLTYLLFGLAYSLVNIPYGSLATAMTQDSVERSKLATFRVFGSNIAILLLAVVVSPQIEGSDDLQRSLTITTIALAVIGTALYLSTFLTSREPVAHSAQIPTLRETFAAARRNKALLVLCGSSVVFLVGWFSLQTVTVYYARNVLGNADYYIVLTVVQTVGVFAAALLVPGLVTRIGKRRVYQALGAIAMLSGIAVAFAPASVPAFAIVAFAFFGIGLGGVNTVSFALQADTVEYGEWATGIAYRGRDLLDLLVHPQGRSGARGGRRLVHNRPGRLRLGRREPARRRGDRDQDGGRALPAAFILTAIAVMSAYPLTEARFQEIVREVAERRAAREEAIQ